MYFCYLSTSIDLYIRRHGGGTIYTDMHIKTTSPKNDRGLRAENRLREHAAGGRYILYTLYRHPQQRHPLAEGTENRGGGCRSVTGLARACIGQQQKTHHHSSWGGVAGNTAGREGARSKTFDTHLTEGIYLRSIPDQRGTIADGGLMT